MKHKCKNCGKINTTIWCNQECISEYASTHRFKRWCRRCDQKFRPAGIHTHYCDPCRKSIRKESHDKMLEIIKSPEYKEKKTARSKSIIPNLRSIIREGGAK